MQDPEPDVHYLPYHIDLRDYQRDLYDALFNKSITNAFIVWHRRSGKDVSSFNLLAMLALTRVGNYHYVFPQLGQGRRVVWQGIDKSGYKFIEHIPDHLIKHKDKIDLRIELINGSTIQIISAESSDKYRGMSSNGMIFSEYAFQDPNCLKAFLPMLRETKGFLIINTTPNGHNHAYRLFNQVIDDESWYTSLLTVTDTKDEKGNPIVSDAQIEEDKKLMSIEEIRQEYFCDWDVALSNSYFSSYLRKAENSKRICDFPIDTTIKVHTFWDLGVSDATSICFVQITPEGSIKFIHYYEQNRVGFESHVNYLHDFRDRMGIVYGTHFLPHDGKNMEFDGTTRKEKLENLVSNVQTVHAPKKKMDAIETTRSHFSKYYIHKSECQYLLDCLMEYHAKKLPNGQTAGPEHNWASHAADAFMLVGLAEQQELFREAGYGMVMDNIACNEYLI